MTIEDNPKKTFAMQDAENIHRHEFSINNRIMDIADTQEGLTGPQLTSLNLNPLGEWVTNLKNAIS